MQLLYTFLIAYFSPLALLLVNAAPTPNDCSPNFQGAVFTIRNYLTNNRWSVGVTPGQGSRIIAAADGVTTFRAEFTGSWPSTQYILKRG